MRRLTLLLVFLLFPVLAAAQGAATLVADRVELSPEGQLIASGNVQALYAGSQLSATQIVYDREKETLAIIGPILLQTPDGIILTARAADLDPQLTNGILLGARLVLEQQVQIAANQIDRIDGRYTQLYRATASSCSVCNGGPPLWSIRSEKVIHDQTEKQLYFEDATFLIRDVPLLWVPRMRLPDPTLKRASGILIPEQRNTTQLGTGLKLPYFLTLGDHADLTVTPYFSPETRTLEMVYRQAFANGDFRARGAISDDSLVEENRSYIFANGNFRFANEYRLNFDVEASSDPAYLLDYGYSDKDRLDSEIELLRVTDQSLVLADFTYYQTLRDDESNASLPPIIASLNYEERLRPNFGGKLTIGGGIDTAYRYSNDDGDAGRDVTRIGGSIDWRKNWLWPTGILLDIQTSLQADLYDVRDDQNYVQNDLRAVPQLAATLRWPWLLSTSSGTSHVIEPVLQFASSRSFGGTPPNEDSTRSDLSAGNLFALSRFAGEDEVETGNRIALGGHWTRLSGQGNESSLTFGRVFRSERELAFNPSSGLSGDKSDWLVAGQIKIPDGFVFSANALLQDDLDATRAAGLIRWKNDDVTLSAAYIWQSPDALENRPQTLSEWSFDAEFDLDEAWSLGLDGRYDVAADRPVRAGLGLQWQNECVTIDVSISRRYTSSSTVEPTTSYGLSGTISGFSAGRSGRGATALCKETKN